MWICSREFHVPKRGAPEADYEDAAFPGNGFVRGIKSFRCAVADGASESAFSREWARLLVRGYGRHQLHLPRLQRRWKGFVDKQGSLPWYLEAKIARGAHAAFVGLSIRDRTSNVHHGRKPAKGSSIAGTWRAFAIGDSCLFHVRDDKLLVVGPLHRSEEFSNNPFLVPSKGSTSVARGAPHVSILTGTWKAKDAFYLATDALAAYLLSEHEAGRSPWQGLRDLGEDDQQPFENLVEELRSADRLHNDDTTLLCVEVV